ncbi:hypothetical protein LTR05_004058 [Lithohypha guttulata]|uniref:Enoyl reductase (ER) domain-containing protein n=1 Tax=Lithohypha guttulata TaxID=1690604 RepID=A0AAN7T2V9_9EURO|nr:hypothetical protein LTR05_004058 [Lithohypha guttulata]
MKSAINLAGAVPKVNIIDELIPQPGPKEVLIKVVVSGSNPKDWKLPLWAETYDTSDGDSVAAKQMAKAKKGLNQGDDIAGIVEEVGKDVIEFKKGDRVAAFHEMGTDGGSYAEYAIAPDHTTFHLPPAMSFEEAATIPLAALTAAVAVFRNLQLPTPWNPATKPTPFVVYGGSTSVGSFAIQLARNSNIHPIISVAGSGKDHVKSLLDTSKGDVVFDYRDGADNVVNQIRDHLKSGGYPQPRHGLDPGIGEPCKKVLTEIVAKDGYIDLVLGVPDWDTAPATKTSTMVGIVHSNAGDDLGLVTCRWFTKALQAGTFKGHPVEVRAGGLEAVEQALKDLKDGKNSARKYVFRIAETPGLSA